MPFAFQVHIQPQWRTLRKWANLPATRALKPP
jgi:hypothetical protein